MEMMSRAMRVGEEVRRVGKDGSASASRKLNKRSPLPTTRCCTTACSYTLESRVGIDQ